MKLTSEQDAYQQARSIGWRHKDTIGYEAVFVDPAFWQALGKARGWSMGVSGISKDAWLYHALRYFETKLSGGDTSTYWQNLP